MEAGGRSFSEIYRNTSEEIFLKTLMEGSVGMPVPTMEMLGFKNLTQNGRTDSEEIFKNWITNGENGYNSSGIQGNPRQVSRRISRELAGLTGHHLGSPLQRILSHETLFAQPTPVPEEQSNDLNQNSTRNVAENGLQASNLFLAKAWFQSSQPMTRSRSSELRRRYVAMQNSQTPLGMHNLSNLSSHHVGNTNEEITGQNGFGDVSKCEIPNQFNLFMSPSNSSSSPSPFNTPLPIDNIDKVTSVVSMLKDTLERKKINNHSEVALYGAQEVFGDTSLNQGHGSHIHESFSTYQDVSANQITVPTFMETLQGSYNMDIDHLVTPINLQALSREPSQSESSAAVTFSFQDVCDGPANSCHTMSKNSRRQTENGSKDMKDGIGSNQKEETKKGSLVRYGSITSAGSVEKRDPTKKRRVERTRKMAEAKEKTLTPPIPSDMQSILKRCENLEKEVRSLKLNLSFMNRKDSEQTKQIEELQSQNDELTDEKERHKFSQRRVKSTHQNHFIGWLLSC